MQKYKHFPLYLLVVKACFLPIRLKNKENKQINQIVSSLFYEIFNELSMFAQKTALTRNTNTKECYQYPLKRKCT